MSPAPGISPRIVVTVMVAADQSDPDNARDRIGLYLAALERQGASPLALDATASPADREAAFGSMDGLLLSGGADLDPALYGQAVDGAHGIERARDTLELAAWTAAEARAIPVLGICRGFQAMNVFAGGRLRQDVHGHAGPSFGRGPALTHPLRMVPGTRMTRILYPANVGGGVLTVNSYHHQGVARADLAPGFVATGIAPSTDGELVEAFETTSGPFRMAVQCHPERTESTPKAFERLFAFFVDACRGPASSR